MLKKPAAPLAFSYIRYSTPEQSKGDSFRRQTEMTDDWCRRHGVVLNDEHRLKDLGVSGFRGDHRHRDNVDKYALAGFLELVRRGLVPEGSYLIVENLDRLSREHVRTALTLVLNLIEAGVKIVQLSPETVLDRDTDEFKLMMVLGELRRGNSESQRKAERLTRSWDAKRKLARETGRILTGKLPFWLKRGRESAVPHPPGAELVRRIFTMSLAGHGIHAISKALNAEGILHRRGRWRPSHVSVLLNDRKVLGEFQPMTGKHPKREPAGPPIPGYYPAVVEEQLFHSVRAGLADRTSRRIGRPGKERVYLLSGLLWDARTRGKITYAAVGKAATTNGPKLVSTAALDGMPNAPLISFPAYPFEEAILGRLCEVDPADLSGEPEPDVLSAIAGQLAETEAQIGRVQAEVKKHHALGPLVQVLAELDERRQAQTAELAAEQARAKVVKPATALEEVRSLAHLARDADNETRLRLRTAVRRVVEACWCYFAGTTSNAKTAVVQLCLAGGGVRWYVVHHKFKHRSGRPAQTRVTTWDDDTSDDSGLGLDMRDVSDGQLLAALELISGG